MADGGVEAEVAHVGALAEASPSRGELLDCCHDERQKLRGMEVLALDQKDAGAGGQKKSNAKVNANRDNLQHEKIICPKCQHGPSNCNSKFIWDVL